MAGTMSDEFDRFWMAYPLKVAKGAARKAWVKTEAIRPPLTEVLGSIARYIEFKNASGFLSYKHPATWIYAECWADVYEIAIEIARPSITCLTCKQKAYMWTDGKCSGCWQRYMGVK